jgi:hypothetical protein
MIPSVPVDVGDVNRDRRAVSVAETLRTGTDNRPFVPLPVDDDPGAITGQWIT